jgi:hypothetical protein
VRARLRYTAVHARLPRLHANEPRACVHASFPQSLLATIVQLEARRQKAKLALFARFQYTLAGSVVVSVVWAVYTMYLSAADDIAEEWESAWFNDAIWEVLYFIVLAAIAVLWRPSKNAQRYAFAHELSSHELADMEDDGDDDDEYGGAAALEGQAPQVEMTSMNQAAAELFGVDVAEELEIGGKTD